MQQAELTAMWVLFRTRDDDSGCLVWTEYSQNGNPRANFGRGARNVRREVWAALHGREPRKNHAIRTTCETCNCVEPAHLVEVRFSEWNAGRKLPLDQRIKLATIERARSHLTEEAIADLRAAKETQEALAAKWKLSQSMVSLIQVGRAWRDYGSPFFALGDQR